MRCILYLSIKTIEEELFYKFKKIYFFFSLQADIQLFRNKTSNSLLIFLFQLQEELAAEYLRYRNECDARY